MQNYNVIPFLFYELTVISIKTCACFLFFSYTEEHQSLFSPEVKAGTHLGLVVRAVMATVMTTMMTPNLCPQNPLKVTEVSGVLEYVSP